MTQEGFLTTLMEVDAFCNMNLSFFSVSGREWKVPLASLNLLRRRPQCPRPGSIVEPIKNSTEGVRGELGPPSGEPVL